MSDLAGCLEFVTERIRGIWHDLEVKAKQIESLQERVAWLEDNANKPLPDEVKP